MPKTSFGHTDHYDVYQFIKMEIFRNDKLIGYNNYFFSRDKDVLLVKNQLKFTVSLFGSDVFNIEGYGEEKYKKNKLVLFKSKTIQNNKEKFVKITYNANSKKFDIKGSSYNGEADIHNVVGNWWNHQVLSANSQISPISGSVKKQVVTFIGKETIKLYGKTFETEHFKLQSKNMTLPKDKRLDFDIWYDKKNAIILKVSYSRMGNWEYRLKNFN
tara:strand:+ start:184 stop:828 length:645 start_codon:yes stop_codon:yes gene_type:complete